MASTEVVLPRGTNAPDWTWTFDVDLTGSAVVMTIRYRRSTLVQTSASGALVVSGNTVTWNPSTETMAALPLGRLSTYQTLRTIAGETSEIDAGYLTLTDGPSAATVSGATVEVPGIPGPAPWLATVVWAAGTYPAKSTVTHLGSTWFTASETDDEPGSGGAPWVVLAAGGADGADGTDGITPDIAFGTVTTLPQGSAATAVLDPASTAENPIINLGLPEGATGPSGDPGAAGLLLSTPAATAFFIPRGVGDLEFANIAAGLKAYNQAMSAVAAGGKFTMIYRVDSPAFGGGGYIRLRPYLGGAAQGSNIDLLTDGLPHIVEFTPASGANILGWSCAFFSGRVKYAVFKGSVADLSATNGAGPALLTMNDLIFAETAKIASVANLSLLLAPVATGSDWTVDAGATVTSFAATLTAATDRSFSIRTLPANEAATLIYRATGTIAGVSVQLDKTSTGDAGPQVALVLDGRWHAVELKTAISGTNNGADRFYVDVTSTGTFAMEYDLIRGSYNDLAPSTTAARTISVLMNALDTAGREPWPETGKQVLYPSEGYYIAGRPVSFYPRNMLVNRRRIETVDMWLTSTAAQNEGKPPLCRHMVPSVTINADDLVGSTFEIALRDPSFPSNLWARPVTWHRADAAQTGTLAFCQLGDSLGDDILQATYWRLLSAGVTPVGYGTQSRDVDDSGSTVTIKHESRAGWSTSAYIGRTRPSTNPFLQSLDPAVPADLAIITANPAVCFSDTAGYGTGVRPSYTDDAGVSASYSIFSWDAWRQNGAVALTGTEKLLVVMGLGRNDSGATAITSLGQSWIVTDFLATFASGHIFVGAETNGWNGSGINRWETQTRPLISMKLDLFDDRTAERVYMIPGWAHMAGEVGYPSTTVSTDVSGTIKRSITDDVHPVYLGYQQYAEAETAALLWVHQQP